MSSLRPSIPLATITAAGVFSLGLLGASTAETSEAAPALPEVLPVDSESLRLLDSPDAESRHAAALAADQDDATVSKCCLYRASATDGADLLVAAVPIVNEVKQFAWLVLDPRRQYVSSAVARSDGTVVDEWRHFMRGLKWHAVPRLDGARPWSQVTRQRTDAEGTDDPKDRLFVALLDLQQAMNDQASIFNLPREGRPLSETEEYEMVTRSFERTAELGPALAPLLGDTVEEFQRIARESAEQTTTFAREASTMSEEESAALRGKLLSNCMACHELAVPGYDDPLKDVSNDRRHELGIGDGFYRVGHDLRIRHPQRDRMQRVADALRLGALLLDGAAPR